MSKAVLISIKPEWCDKIIKEKKTIEVRKMKPTIELPFKCFIYCTKGATTSDNLWITDLSGYNHLGNGKVIGEFICDDIHGYWYPFGYNKTDCSVILTKLGCLSIDEVWEYGKGKTLYGWHISDLKIYDEPKELSEFRTICKYGDDYPCHICNKAKRENDHILYCDNALKRPPQSWCYVEEI